MGDFVCNEVMEFNSTAEIIPAANQQEEGPVRSDSREGCTKASSSEHLPLVMEYFGVAIALCALGLFQSPGCKNPGAPESFEGLPNATLRNLLKGAMERLHRLARNAIALEERTKQQAAENSGTAEKWEVSQVERSHLLKRITEIRSEVHELRKRRAEDARANEKVASIFATREQAWKEERRKYGNEQRRLWQELQRAFTEQEALRQKIQRLKRASAEGTCEDCEQRDTLVVELRERVGEQEFLIMASMEETKAEQQERNALAGKLAAAEVAVTELRDKLAHEVEERAYDIRQHRNVVAELQSRLRQMEEESSHALEKLKSAQNEIFTFTAEKKRHDERVGLLSSELRKLQKDGREKEEIISAMLRKNNADTEERYELERELVITKAKHSHAEREKEKWKKLIEEKTRSGRKKELFRPRNSFEGKTESGLDMIGELQRLHDVELRNLQFIFEEQVKVLQNRVRLYQERVADLEENILLHMADSKCIISLPKAEHREEAICAEPAETRDLTVMKHSMEAEIATKQFQLSVAKALLTQYMDSDAHREREAENWKQMYFASKATVEMLQKDKEQTGTTLQNPRLQDLLELEKARQASKMEQRHWQEIDSFERQMRAKDERMEAFRWQLLAMESEAQRRTQEIEALNKRLASAMEAEVKLEEFLKEKEANLGAERDQTLPLNNECTTEEAHKRDQLIM